MNSIHDATTAPRITTQTKVKTSFIILPSVRSAFIRQPRKYLNPLGSVNNYLQYICMHLFTTTNSDPLPQISPT